MLLATFFFSIMGVLVKFLQHIPAHELVFFRAVVTFCCCGYLLWRDRISPLGKNIPVLLLRGLAGTISLWLFFYTLQVLPLASAISLHFLSPIFTIFLAGFFLKEPARRSQWICFGVAFIGVLFIKGFDARVSAWGVILAAFGALGSAIAYNLVRILKRTDPPAVIIFYFSMVTIPLMGPYTFLHWSQPELKDWPLILLVGLTTQFAQVNLTKALHLEKAANVTHLNYLSLVYALVFGFFLFGEYVPLPALLGMGIIIFSVILANQIARIKEGQAHS